MSYSDFLSSFFTGMTQCTRWLKNLFVGPLGEGSPLFTEHLIFTIIAISVFLLLIEEILGLISSFRFGGFLFRRFGRPYGSGYFTRYETEYPKSYEVDYSSHHKVFPFGSKYRSKYFIEYDGRYYPFRHSPYNPFFRKEFNNAFREGRIVSSSQIHQRNGNNSSFHNTHSVNSSGYHLSSVNGSFGGLGRGYGKLMKLANKYRKMVNQDAFTPQVDNSNEENLFSQSNNSPDASFSFVPDLPASKPTHYASDDKLLVTPTDEEWEEWEHYYDDKK